MQILQLQVDSAGNQGWVLVNTVASMSQADAVAYLAQLAQDGNTYMAQLVTSSAASVLGVS